MKAKWRTIIEWELDTDTNQSRIIRQFTKAISTDYKKKETKVVEATAVEGEKIEWQ